MHPSTQIQNRAVAVRAIKVDTPLLSFHSLNKFIFEQGGSPASNASTTLRVTHTDDGRKLLSQVENKITHHTDLPSTKSAESMGQSRVLQNRRLPSPGQKPSCMWQHTSVGQLLAPFFPLMERYILAYNLRSSFEKSLPTAPVSISSSSSSPERSPTDVTSCCWLIQDVKTIV